VAVKNNSFYKLLLIQMMIYCHVILVVWQSYSSLLIALPNVDTCQTHSAAIPKVAFERIILKASVFIYQSLKRNYFKGNKRVLEVRVGSTCGTADQLVEFLWLSFWKILYIAYISCMIILLQTK
jgi:hypothetical protein